MKGIWLSPNLEQGKLYLLKVFVIGVFMNINISEYTIFPHAPIFAFQMILFQTNIIPKDPGYDVHPSLCSYCNSS